MRFKIKLKNNLFYAGVDKDSFKKAQKKIDEDNFVNLRFVLILALSYYVLSFLLCFLFHSIKSKQSIYLIESIILGSMIVLHLLFSKKNLYIQKTLIVVTEASLLMTGQLMGIIGNVERLSVMLMVILIVVPILFADRPIKIIFLVLINDILFLILEKQFKKPDVYVIDAINLITYSSLGLIIGCKITNIRYERYIYEISVNQLAEDRYTISNTDEPTGLLNRRAYYEKIEEIKKEDKKFGFIMFDLNGLKRANDKYGHLAGDELITGAAYCLKKVFDRQEYIFRYGGDEFIVISFEPETMIKNTISKLNMEIEKWNKKSQYKLSLSSGLSYYNKTRELDFNELLTEADSAMYKSKKAYYEKTGYDRRLN